ncbi:hypothetical protein BG011_000900, partial [Mortierella polycephala]
MPSPARPPVHTLQSGVPLQGLGPAIDPAFTAPGFDVKAWINAALNAAPRHQQDSTTQLAITSASSTSNGSLKPSQSSATLDNADSSLDASLDLLQTPALDPVL